MATPGASPAPAPGRKGSRPGAKPRPARRAPASRRPRAPGGPLAAFCRTLPGATEDIKWGDDLVFSVGGKMFAAFDVEDTGRYGFKCAEDDFWRLIQRDGIIPAPYAARFHWVAIRRRGALPPARAMALLRKAHGIVLAGLPRRTRAKILDAAATRG